MSSLSLCSRLNLVAAAVMSSPVELQPGSSLSWYFGFLGKLTKVSVYPNRFEPKRDLIVEVTFDSGRAFVEGMYTPGSKSIIGGELHQGRRRAVEELNFKHDTLPGGFRYPQVTASSSIRVAKDREGAHA